MVMVWVEAENKGIAITKMRIKHHEKHGNGDIVIQEKAILKQQERHKELRKMK